MNAITDNRGGHVDRMTPRNNFNKRKYTMNSDKREVRYIVKDLESGVELDLDTTEAKERIKMGQVEYISQYETISKGFAGGRG